MFNMQFRKNKSCAT